MSPELRDYQLDVIERCRREVARGRRRILLVAPTGSGKTIIAASIVAGAAAKGNRAVFLAPRRELIGQAVNKLADCGIDAGVVLPGYPHRPDQPVQVASVWSLDSRALRSSKIDMPPADLVVVDEAHHSRAPTFARLLQQYPETVLLGLTATPCRGDGRGLGNVFDCIVETPSVAELTRLGHLVRAVVYAPSNPDLTGVEVRRGDYVETQLAERVDTPQLVGDIVEHWHRLAQRRPTVVFATGVRHSVHLRDEFCRSGVLAEHLDGSTPTEERDAILARLECGQTEVVTNCSVLCEGWDQPKVSCLVLARPTKSLGLFRQMAGRVLRPYPGKLDALILDHSGAIYAHGLPEDDIVWTLREDKRAENRAHAARGGHHAPGLVECPECKAIRMQGKPCPACSWMPRTRGAEVEVAEGNLARIGYDRVTRTKVVTMAEKRQFYAELLWIILVRGNSPGRAAHLYREKFGVWPCFGDVTPAEPQPATWAWVKSRQIAYAKALQKAAAA
jgi:DNA repair protein RadD